MQRRVAQFVLAALVASSGVVLGIQPASAAVAVQTLGGTLTADTLAQELAGAGVTVSNVTFSGVPTAAGIFANGTTAVGFDSGVILSSGNATYVAPPNDSSSQTQSNGGAGDPQLDVLAGVATHDAAILEFDLVPNASQLYFTYVFGSEEYNEYVDAGVNDVFAFYVGGQNCAVVPNSGSPGIPVSIDTINLNDNPSFYRNNDVQPTPFETQLDGLTVPMSCQAAVTPNVVNHIKLAIADGGDSVLDSDVFLQAGSFSTAPPGTPSTNLQPKLAAPTPADGTAFVAELGQTLTFDVQATDPDPGDTVELLVSGSPNAVLAHTGETANPRTATVTFTPPSAGTFVITFGATDNHSLPATGWAIRILVRMPTNLSALPALVALPPVVGVTGLPGAPILTFGAIFLPNVSARLTLPDAAETGVPGKLVRFVAPGNAGLPAVAPPRGICNAVTGPDGWATCNALLPDPTGELAIILSFGYWAIFDGDGTHRPSSAAGPLLLLFGNALITPPPPPPPVPDPGPAVPSSLPGALGDFDGNGATNIGAFRPATGGWWDFATVSTLAHWGGPGDIQVNGDYNGDGKAEIAIFRPSSGTWWFVGGPPVNWGQSGDVPVPADYNGDGKLDIAVYRPTGGLWYVLGAPSVAWGQPGDIPAPGDYNGDGKAEMTVFRPADGVWWVKDGPVVQWGLPGDMPLPGDYVPNPDGVRKAEVAVFRPSDGTWHIAGGPTPFSLGLAGDIPVPADYNGDGKLDAAVFTPATGKWTVRHAIHGPEQWGMACDMPVQARPTVQVLYGCPPAPPPPIEEE